MDIEEKIKGQIKEINDFVSKQMNNISENEKLILESIDKIEDKKIKANVSEMLKEAKNGNIENVQTISNNLMKIAETLNKK